MEGETRFAALGPDRIAYQVLGEGPDLVLVTGTLSHVDVRWEEPLHARFLRRLASFSRARRTTPRIAAGSPVTSAPRHGRAGQKFAGIAIHVGARIVSLASPGEILDSSTVRDLATGSGLAFADRGDQALKGAPGEWRLFAAG